MGNEDEAGSRERGGVLSSDSEKSSEFVAVQRGKNWIVDLEGGLEVCEKGGSVA